MDMPISLAWPRSGAFEPKLVAVPWVSVRVGPGLSYNDGNDGFIAAVLAVLVVFIVLVRVGPLEYGGSVADVLMVSERVMPVTPEYMDMLSPSDPPSFGSVGMRASAPPFFKASRSSFLRFKSCFSRAFLIFLLTMRSRRVSIFLRQYWVKPPSALGT